VLWRHVSAYLAPEWKSEWIAPVYLGDVPHPTERSDRVNFCVQGNIAFDRRNYESLVAATEQLLGAGESSFRITFVGRSDTPDGLAFRARLARSAASAVTDFTAPSIPYRDYYSILAGSDFILPLVDTSTPEYSYYFVDKATSSLAVTIGLGVVPVLQSRLAQLYEVSDSGICHEDGQLAEAMSQALVLGSKETLRLREGLAKRREALLAETVANLRRAVEAVS
jgi:hypothetical protein